MKPLFLDCQTTGMHPSLGHLLELAWESEAGERQFLIRLPEGKMVPAKVTELTGISDEHLAEAVDVAEALAALEADLDVLGEESVLVAHYAQFERAFLATAWAAQRGVPFNREFLCTQRIARLLFPAVPSRNIRALTGYFGFPGTELRRAREHVGATKRIWERLTPLLSERGLADRAAISKWLGEAKAPKATKLEFRVDRLRRLGLPDRPGVYRMLDKGGSVLYVGKATSLRDRVNSYFRGRKGPGPRKREMLAQVYDVQFTATGTAIEAALLECEEIKRFNPPYNVSLKAGSRALCFFSRDFESVACEQDERHPYGPVGRSSAIGTMLEWKENPSAQIFHDDVPGETLLAGLSIFLARRDWAELPSLRSMLALGCRVLRALDAEERSLEAAEPVEEDREDPLTPEGVADRYDRLLARAAWEHRRGKWLTRLLDCRVSLGAGAPALEVRGGALGGREPSGARARWAGLGIADYDRMSVLLTEINRHGYPVETRMGPW